MRHLKRGRKLKRDKKQREALLRGLAQALFAQSRIKTTETKAKELRPFAEKMISRAKKNDLASRRLIGKILNKEALKLLFNVVAPKYKERNGGYTRIIKKGPRIKDRAREAIIELV